MHRYCHVALPRGQQSDAMLFGGARTTKNKRTQDLEDRQYRKRRRQHLQAMTGWVQEDGDHAGGDRKDFVQYWQDNTDDLLPLPQSSADKQRRREWATAGKSNFSTRERKPYVPYRRPTGPWRPSKTQPGTNTSEDRKAVMDKLGLPTNDDSKPVQQMVGAMYQHFYGDNPNTVPDIPLYEKASGNKKKKSPNALMRLLIKHFGEEDQVPSVRELYIAFKRLMNDPTTYDTPDVKARYRVQPPPGKKDKDMILEIPKRARDGKPDRRFTRGDYHSARDLLNPRLYMSVAGGPFGSYQLDLLDMRAKAKRFNYQYQYLMTLLNTNSRFVYACAIKKGEPITKNKSARLRKELRQLSNDPVSKSSDAKWVRTEVIPALEKILARIEQDVAKNPQNLQHRLVKHITMDKGVEFQKTFREHFAQDPFRIAFTVAETHTHEQLTRLNSFHRYFRQRYQAQWRKYHEDPRGYGGPVRWVSDAQGNGRGTEALPAIEEEEEEEQEQEGKGWDDSDSEEDEQDQKQQEDQKQEVKGDQWRITFWEDWVDAHNNAAKRTVFRGAETRRTAKGKLVSARVAKAPVEITDDMVRALIRHDNEKKLETKRRVDQWIQDHHVVWQAALPGNKKDYATRVRLDLTRTVFGDDINFKSSKVESRWSERHYALVERAGTNTFEVDIDAALGSDFPRIWPMYRLRIVENPSDVAQPVRKETKLSVAERDDGKHLAPLKTDLEVLQRLEQKAQQDKLKEEAEEDRDLDKMAQMDFPPQKSLREPIQSTRPSRRGDQPRVTYGKKDGTVRNARLTQR